ncbi:MAG: hypothetical protein ACOYNS_07290 [Bacteroidota bacterium]
MKILSLISVLILFSQFTFSQEIEETSPRVRITLFGGASLPQSAFSSTTGTDAGFALTGFAGGLEVNSQLNGSLSWNSSLSLASNGMDAKEMEKQSTSGVTLTTGNYLTTWGLTGVRFSAKTATGATLYCQAQVGLLYSSFPDIDVNFMGNSLKQTTTSNAAFAAGFGAGLQLQKISIGVRYYNGKPEYEEKAVGAGQTFTAKVKLPATVLLLIIGVTL